MLTLSCHAARGPLARFGQDRRGDATCAQMHGQSLGHRRLCSAVWPFDRYECAAIAPVVTGHTSASRSPIRPPAAITAAGQPLPHDAFKPHEAQLALLPIAYRS